MSVGRVEGRIVISGRDAASAKVDHVSRSVDRLGKKTKETAAETTGLAAASAQAKGALGAMGTAIGALGAAAGAAGLTALFSGMQSFAIAGEKAINVTRAAQRTLTDYSGSLAAAKAAVAGLVTETGLEKFLTRTALLGVSATEQMRLLTVATKAALALEMDVGETMRILVDVAKGRTGRVPELGVEIDQAAMAGKTGMEKLIIVVGEMEATYNGISLDDYMTTMQRGKIVAEDLESTMQAKFATLADSVSQASAVMTRSMEAVAEAMTALGRVGSDTSSAMGVYMASLAQIAPAQLEAAASSHRLATGMEENRVVFEAMVAEMGVYAASVAQLERLERAQLEAAASSHKLAAGILADRVMFQAALVDGQRLLDKLDGLTDAELALKASTNELAEAQREYNSMLAAGGTSADAYGAAMGRLLSAQQALAALKLTQQIEQGTEQVASAMIAANLPEPQKPRGGGGGGKKPWTYGESAGETMRGMGFTGADQPSGLGALDVAQLPGGSMFGDDSGLMRIIRQVDQVSAAMAASRKEFDAESEAISRLAAAFGGAAGTIGPAAAAIASGLKAMSSATDAAGRAQGAIDAVVGGLGAAFGEMLGDIRELAPAMIALELAQAGTAIFTNPWSIPVHLANAAAWGVALARASGGGDAAAAPARAAGSPGAGYTRSPLAESTSNTQPIVIHMKVEAALGAEQEAANRVASRIAALAGTGLGQRPPGV